MENFAVHRRSHAHTSLRSVFHDICIFRRNRRRSSQISFFCFHKEIFKKQNGIFKNSIILFHKFQIFCKSVMLHNMQRKPCPSHNPVSCRNILILRCSVCMNVRIMMCHKSSASVHFFGCLFPALTNTLQKCKKWLITFRKAAHICRPVVHLKVDVNRKLGVPCRIDFTIPDSLKIRGQSSFSAAGNHEIARIMKIQRKQSGVFFSLTQTFQSFIHRKNFRLFIPRKFQFHFMIKSSKICPVIFF